MWATLVCIGLGLTWSPSPDRASGTGGPRAARRPVLAIMSLEPGEFALRLEHHWGGLGANRVSFDGHDGPFEAVTHRSADGIGVIFIGWEERPFTASSRRLQVVYRSPTAGRTEFVVEPAPDGGVQLRVAGRPPIRGARISVRLGVADVKVEATPARRAGNN